MDDFLKKYLGRMPVSQKDRTLRTWAYVPVARFALVNVAVIFAAHLHLLLGDALHWQLENLFKAISGPVTYFCVFNLVALSVFWKLRRYARNHPSMRHKFRKSESKAAARAAN